MRQPTQAELDQLLEVYLQNYADDEWCPTKFEKSAATDLIAKALKVVWEDVEIVDPLAGIDSYVGKVMIVMWPDSLKFVDVLIWKDDRMMVTEPEPILT